jgi:hypothetical protein
MQVFAGTIEREMKKVMLVFAIAALALPIASATDPPEVKGGL